VTTEWERLLSEDIGALLAAPIFGDDVAICRQNRPNTASRRAVAIGRGEIDGAPLKR